MGPLAKLMKKLVDQYVFRSSHWSVNLLIVVSGGNGRTFDKTGATWVAAIKIPKACGRIWHGGLLYKPKFYGILGWAFGRILSFLSNRWLCVVLDARGPINADFPQSSFPGFTLFVL